MSSFFDKKEEVIEVELTQYGKHLLSRGEFKPVYYSFFDDDILYDVKYASQEEEQNYSQDRILDETPNTRVQYVYSSREDSVTEAVYQIRSGKMNLREPSLQQTPEKHYALSAPLGNSSYVSSYAPSWNITSLVGDFTEAIKYKQGAHQTFKIPQIEMTGITCTTEVLLLDERDPSSKTVYDNNTIMQAGEFGQIGSPGEPQLEGIKFPDGSFLELTCNDILLEIEEENTECLKDNFEIEVYLIEEVDMSGKVVTPGLESNDKVEKLIPLKFAKRFTNVIDNILVDDPIPQDDYNYDSTFVEHYFDISVDKQIDKSVLCKAGVQPSSVKCGGLSRDFLDCLEQPRIVGGIYKQIVDGEEC